MMFMFLLFFLFFFLFEIPNDSYTIIINVEKQTHYVVESGEEPPNSHGSSKRLLLKNR